MLQYITHFNDKYDYVEGAILALKGGCKWIQLRMKDASKEEILEKAVLLKRECLKYNARLIIDDHVDIVIPSGADGVHLGKNDMDPSEARAILGKEKVIGGTANSFDDIKTLNSKGDRKRVV